MSYQRENGTTWGGTNTVDGGNSTVEQLSSNEITSYECHRHCQCAPYVRTSLPWLRRKWMVKLMPVLALHEHLHPMSRRKRLEAIDMQRPAHLGSSEVGTHNVGMNNIKLCVA